MCLFKVPRILDVQKFAAMYHAHGSYEHGAPCTFTWCLCSMYMVHMCHAYAPCAWLHLHLDTMYMVQMQHVAHAPSCAWCIRTTHIVRRHHVHGAYAPCAWCMMHHVRGPLGAPQGAPIRIYIRMQIREMSISLFVFPKFLCFCS